VALAACSPSREDVPPPQRRVEPRQSIDIQMPATAPFSIRGVEVARGPNHSLELGYRLEAASSSLNIPGELTCRVQGFNLVYPAAATGKVPGPRLTGLWRPDPFAADPEVCQIDWLLNDASYASACFRGGELVTGACPAGSFPPRTEDELKTSLAGKFMVDLVHATFAVRDGSATVSGVFTKLDRFAEGHRILAQLSCHDPAGRISGEASMPLVPLERLVVGASVFGPAAFLLERTPADGANCVFRLVSRAVKDPSVEKELAKYCVAAGTSTVLTCPL
jgi:hypothetical protein